MAFVRVKGPDGAEFTVAETAAASMGLPPLNKPAVDVNGRPLAPKHPTTLDGKPRSSEKPKEG